MASFTSGLHLPPACSAVITPLVDGLRYIDLFLTPDEAAQYAPTIADVHTDPASMRVLHVGTAGPRLMVMTAETCSGPRAYAGLVSAYSETLTRNFQRLQDSDWLQRLTTLPPDDVPWMTNLVVH